MTMKHDDILKKLAAVLPYCWGADTSVYGSSWSTANPASGQCGVTALIVNDMTGLRVVSGGIVDRQGNFHSHVWNEGEGCGQSRADLTSAQFSAGIAEYIERNHGEKSLRDALLSDSALLRRYKILKSRVANHLASFSLGHG